MTRQLLVPEVLQTSLMDCGPAALKALLQGFGIAADYDALRERCQTDVDGTSIDAIARLGAELGLHSSQLLVPRDSFLLPEARCLPAIVVTRSSAGQLHFLLVWSRVGPFVQVMDPASGRRWLRCESFLAKMPDLPSPLSAQRFRRWAGSPDAIAPLCAKLRALRVAPHEQRALLELAARDRGWYAFAALDAATRMVASLVHSRALARGSAATRLLRGIFERVIALAPERRAEVIPERFWWVSPQHADKLLARGGVIVHFARRSASDVAVDLPRHNAADAQTHEPVELAPGLPPELAPMLNGDGLQPLRVLWRLARHDAPAALWSVAVALPMAAALVPLEAALLRSLLDVSRFLALGYQRVAGLLLLVFFMGLSLACDWIAARGVHRIGRGLEQRLRVALLHKLPRLDDRFLRSRTSADVASRGHTMHWVRELPAQLAPGYRALWTLLFATASVVWLWPEGVMLALSAAVGGVAAPLLLRRTMVETATRLRTHASALERFYLDALLGVVPIRVHGAERAVRVEHESLLTEWGKTARAMCLQSCSLQSLQLIVTTSLSVLLVCGYALQHADTAGLLLFAFLASRIPTAAHELVQAQISYRSLRSLMLRLLAPLGATQSLPPSAASACEPAAEPGVAIELRGVGVLAGGHRLLEQISVELPAGSHVAIVGASGAGKSTLLALLLGFVAPSSGELWIDGRRADAARLAALRRALTWVDPAVQLWDRPLYDNVTFGSESDATTQLPRALCLADLHQILDGLPDGMQAELGEAGVRLSGGQGQRVRLARGLMRHDARLVLLDEPYRGLERDQRRALLARTRAHFSRATLLFVSHDVAETTELDRVLVLDSGKIVEDGKPHELLARPSSRYRALVDADRALRSDVWSHTRWSRLRLRDGAIEERDK